MFENPVLMIAGGAVVLGIIIVVVVLILSGSKNKKDKSKVPKTKEELAESYEQMMRDDVYHIFGKEFHEELRNKARLDFQKVINENAMFLQQDLRLTTSEINEYLKKEVSGKLEEEFAAYQQSIRDVQSAAVESINKTVIEAQQQQAALNERIKQEVDAQKVQVVAHFEENMAEIVNHYIVKTLGQQIDLKDQMPFILREMEAQKEAMKKDMWL